MLRKIQVVILLLFSVWLVDSRAQQPTLVQRLGIVGSNVHLRVQAVTKGSAAEKGGLRINDQLMIFDAQPLASSEDLLRAVASAAPGNHELTVLRDGKVKQVGVNLGSAAAGRLGIAVVSGVRIDGMLRGTPAFTAGLQKDDLITSLKAGEKVMITATVEDLGKAVAAIPDTQAFSIVYRRADMVITQTIELGGAQEASASATPPAASAQALPQQPAAGGPANGASLDASQTPRPAYQRRGTRDGGERQGDYVVPSRQTRQDEAPPAPSGASQAPRGRGSSGLSPQVLEEMRNARMAQRRRNFEAANSSAGAVRANATLDGLLQSAHYTPPASIAKRMAEINVLSYAYIDKHSGEAVFVGRYDPAYATGPIPYGALLADALTNPYPSFTLEYPRGNGQAPLTQMRATLDAEFARVSRDPNYGVQWLERLVLPVIKGDSADPDQQAALSARLRAAGITPESYRAYMKWQLGHFSDMQAYNEGAGDFLPSLMQSAGLSRKAGAELNAYRVFASQKDRASLDRWCAVAGYTDFENQIVQRIQATGNSNLASSELLPVLYASILRGLGMPDGQVNQLVASYKNGGGNEALFVNALDERYQAIFKQLLMNKIVNGMTFTGTTLSRQYGFPPIQSPLNTYGARRDSPIMHVFFQADYMLKFVTSSPRPAAAIPSHETSQAFLAEAENSAGAAAGRQPNSGVVRYWIYPRSVEMDTLSGNSGVHFRQASVRVGVESLQADGADATGMNFYKAALNRYSERLSSLYDQYARVYPVLHTLQETEKVIALARWAQKNGVRIHAVSEETPAAALPETVDGFWGMTYIVRPRGDTDTMITWAEGGVDFGQSAGDAWVQSGPPSREATDDALRSLAASTALSEKAAAAATSGDLEAARNLAERGAEAMSGNIDLTNLPGVPAPTAAAVDPASVAAVSQASIEAVDKNVAGLNQAKQDLARAATLSTSDPAQAAQLSQQAQQLQDRSEQDLTRLQTMLQQYRGALADGYSLAVDLRGLDPNKAAVAVLPHSAPPAAHPQPPGQAQPAKQCSPAVERALPSREELLIELATRRIELDSLKNSLLRLNRAIQLDQKQYAEWQDEASKAVERITERRDQMIQDATFNCLTEVLKIRLAKDKTLSEAARKDQERKLQFLENLKSFSDYKDWALSHKDDWEMMDEGFRQTLEFLPLDENPELSISVHSAEALVDGTYDVADFYATWSHLHQLDRNSEQYLAIVKKNGEKMKALVTRIKDLETQLNAAPARPAGTTYCKSAGE